MRQNAFGQVKRRVGESVLEYGARIRDLSESAYSEQDAVQRDREGRRRFLAGLNPELLAKMPPSSRGQTLTDLIHFALEIEGRPGLSTGFQVNASAMAILANSGVESGNVGASSGNCSQLELVERFEDAVNRMESLLCTETDVDIQNVECQCQNEEYCQCQGNEEYWEEVEDTRTCWLCGIQGHIQWFCPQNIDQSDPNYNVNQACGSGEGSYSFMEDCSKRDSGNGENFYSSGARCWDK